MKRLKKIPIFVLFSFALLFTACDSGGGMNDDPPEVTVQAETVDKSGQLITAGTIVSGDDTVGTNGSANFSVEPGQSVPLTGTASGYVRKDSTISVPSADRISGPETISVNLTLAEKLPDQVTLSFSNVTVDGDTSTAGTWTWKGETIASGVASGTHTVPGSDEAGDLCFAENEFYEKQCEEQIPSQDRTIKLSVQRKQVTIASTPEDSNGAVIPDAVTFVGSDSVEIPGDGSIKRPKRSGTRTLVGDWITEENNSSKLNRYRSETITVSAAENIDRDIVIDQLIPACSDGLDNDGDGAVDKAEGPACTDLQGVYDPEDDNEVLKAFTRVSGKTFDDSTFVSSAMNERVEKIRPAVNPLPSSVTVAKSSIDFAIEVSVTKDTTGEDFAVHLKTGASNDNLTVEKTSEIVVDQDTADGIVLKDVFGINRSFFADGPNYAIYMWHGSKAREEGYGDGVDRVFVSFGKEWNSANRLSFIYEPEDVPETNKRLAFQQTQSATLGPSECRKISETDKTCRVPADEVSDF